jgi:flagellar motor switch protein FliM
MILALGGGADGVQFAGVVALDLQLRSALVEVQTTGILSPSDAQDRPVTSVDAALATPVVDGFVADLCAHAQGSELQGWLDDLRVVDRFDSPRTTGLKLGEGTYRTMRLAMDFGVGGRSGEVLIAVKVAPAAQITSDENPGAEWARDLSDVVHSAPVELRAVLHRTKITLRDIEGLEVGQLLPLHGCRVNAVALEGQGRHVVARGRLGQVNGMCAIRVQADHPMTMQDITGQDMPGQNMPGAHPASPGSDPLMDQPQIANAPVQEPPKIPELSAEELAAITGQVGES